MKIDILSNTPEGYESKITKDQKTDSLLYWYKPKFEVDSLLFLISNKSYIDTLTVKIKSIN